MAAHKSIVSGAVGLHGAPVVVAVAARARGVGVEGKRGRPLAAALVVPAPPAKTRRATGFHAARPSTVHGAAGRLGVPAITGVATLAARVGVGE